MAHSEPRGGSTSPEWLCFGVFTPGQLLRAFQSVSPSLCGRRKECTMTTHLTKRSFAGIAIAMAASLAVTPASWGSPEDHNPVLEWNQIFIDPLVATNTPNSSSQRLGAIFH